MKLTVAIQVLSALLAILAMLNLLVLVLSESIQRFVPLKLTPAASYMDAVVAFGIGSGVYCLAVMARNSQRGAAKH